LKMLSVHLWWNYFDNFKGRPGRGCQR
jgi:hypothetical protein